MNEVTFVGRLAAAVRLRADRVVNEGKPVLISTGDVEEKNSIRSVENLCDATSASTPLMDESWPVGK